MFILKTEKTVFLKTLKTAGTKIETSVHQYLREDDIQLKFGHGREFREGKNAHHVKFDPRTLLSLRFWFLLPWAFKWLLSNHEIVNEHIDLDQLLWMQPKLLDHLFVLVLRDEDEVNSSNSRMYKRRYNSSPPKKISNKLYFQSRISFLPLPKMIVIDFENLHDISEINDFLKEVDFNWSDRVNSN
jgi:hypothetical protein